jgi:hypothetical protein
MGSFLVRALGYRSIEQQVIYLVLAEPVERLLGKQLDRSKIGQLKREDRDGLLCTIVVYAVVRSLGPGRVSGS